jgi:hypothetical protein
MSTLNPRRFASVGTLKKVHINYLVDLLEQTGGDFVSSRVELVRDDDAFDYKGLSALLLTPQDGFPVPLADALHHINEMATPEGMDKLLEAADDHDMELDLGDEPTPADVALQIWLLDSDVLEEVHAEQYRTMRARSFECSIGKVKGPTAFTPPSTAVREAVEAALDNWFVKKKRGRHSRVFVFPKDDKVWFLVRHGEPMDRRGIIKEGESTISFVRPEKYDVVIYDAQRDELRINAASKGEKALYILEFGRHLFGDKDYFEANGKYSLEPLRELGEDSLACEDIPGMDWVRLKEIHYWRGGSEKEIEIRKAQDYFAALTKNNRTMPPKAPIFRAKFEVKFTNGKNTRTVAVTTPNRAQYTRDEDSVAVELWLERRGFSLNGAVDDLEEP